MYERHTYKQMVYTLPVKRGKVTLVLKFAEVQFKLRRCTLLKPVKEYSILRLAHKLSEVTLMWSKRPEEDMRPMKSTLKLMCERMESTLKDLRSREDSAALETS